MRKKVWVRYILVLLLFFITVPLCSWWVFIHKILDQAKKICRQKLFSKIIVKNYYQKLKSEV